MAAPLLDEKIVAVHEAFGAAEVPHAFGGAVALAYYATPRATVDVDVNVFLPVEQSEGIFSLLEGLGASRPIAAERARLERDGQTRVRWGASPIDLFFAYDPLHAACLERIRAVPFGAGVEIPILSAEDLAVFKVLFDRDKDWRDLAEMLFAQADAFDAGYAQGWLRRILDPGDQRLARFASLLEAGPP